MSRFFDRFVFEVKRGLACIGFCFVAGLVLLESPATCQWCYYLWLRASIPVEQRVFCEEVAPNIFVAWDFNCPEVAKPLYRECIRDQARRAEEVFGYSLSVPVLLRLRSGPLSTKSEEGHHTLGTYMLNSPAVCGTHLIDVSDAALADGVALHELAHAYTSSINPNIRLMLSEGIAHYVQHPPSTTPLATHASFPAREHWKIEGGKGDTDSFEARWYGYVVVAYLHEVKGVPIVKIPLLADDELPNAEEVRTHSRKLLVQHSIESALRSTLFGLPHDAFRRLYLHGLIQPRADGTTSALSAARQHFNDVVTLTVFSLRMREWSAPQIQALSESELLSHAPQDAETLDAWLDEHGAFWGLVTYLESPNGISMPAYRRLLADSYAPTREGALQRVCDQGWAKVFLRNRLGMIDSPDFDASTIVNLITIIGPADKRLDALDNFETAGMRADMMENSP